MERRSMGRPTVLLEDIRRDAKAGTAHVPCNGCTQCCRSPNIYIELTLEEAGRLQSHVDEKYGPILARKPDGSCVYLTDAGCSIHTSRPVVCRKYDCRLYALMGIIPNPDQIMFDAIDQWYPDLSTDADFDMYLALRLSADAAAVIPGEVNVFAVVGRTWRDFLPEAAALRESAHVFHEIT